MNCFTLDFIYFIYFRKLPYYKAKASIVTRHKFCCSNSNNDNDNYKVINPHHNYDDIIYAIEEILSESISEQLFPADER